MAVYQPRNFHDFDFEINVGGNLKFEHTAGIGTVVVAAQRFRRIGRAVGKYLGVLYHAAGCIQYGTGDGYRRLTGEVADVLRAGNLGRPGVGPGVICSRMSEDITVSMNLNGELGSRREGEFELAVGIETVEINGHLLRRIIHIHCHDGYALKRLGVTIGNRTGDDSAGCTCGNRYIQAVLPGG